MVLVGSSQILIRIRIQEKWYGFHGSGFESATLPGSQQLFLNTFAQAFEAVLWSRIRMDPDPAKYERADNKNVIFVNSGLYIL